MLICFCYNITKKNMHKLNFLTSEIIAKISKNFPTPLYIYSENEKLKAISNFKSVPFEFDYQIRYAMKANSNINILKIFKNNFRNIFKL